jgi:hypothetical protein
VSGPFLITRQPREPREHHDLAKMVGDVGHRSHPMHPPKTLLWTISSMNGSPAGRQLRRVLENCRSDPHWLSVLATNNRDRPDQASSIYRLRVMKSWRHRVDPDANRPPQY